MISRLLYVMVVSVLLYTVDGLGLSEGGKKGRKKGKERERKRVRASGFMRFVRGGDVKRVSERERVGLSLALSRTLVQCLGVGNRELKPLIHLYSKE